MVGPRMICLSVKEKSFQGNCSVSDLLKSKSKLEGSRETCELSGCSANDLSVRLIHTVFSPLSTTDWFTRSSHRNWRALSTKWYVQITGEVFPWISPRALCLTFYNFEFELGLLFVKLHCSSTVVLQSIGWTLIYIIVSEEASAWDKFNYAPTLASVSNRQEELARQLLPCQTV